MVATDLDPRFTFDSFVVGPANRLASAAARRVADAPGTSYNPLFIYSSSGLGKSHILNGIAHYAARVHPGFGVVYVAVESFLEELTEAIRAGTEEELRQRYEELHILLLDDVQFLTGQKEAQEMLLRLLDEMSKSDGQVVLASDRSPSDIDGLDERLVTRFWLRRPDQVSGFAILTRQDRSATGRAGSPGANTGMYVGHQMRRESKQVHSPSAGRVLRSPLRLHRFRLIAQISEKLISLFIHRVREFHPQLVQGHFTSGPKSGHHRYRLNYTAVYP